MIRWFDTLDSTNSEALRRLAEFPSGTVLAAREQTAGRGQRGNTWFSEPGKNLTFSIILKFAPGELAAGDAHYLYYAASLAVVRLLEGYGIQAQVKWPNDIYTGDRKICGMLVENRLEGPWVSASVLGIGLNVNQREFPQLAAATSVVLAGGRKGELDLVQCLEALLGHFDGLLPSAIGPDRKALTEEYAARLFRRGESARYHDLLRDKEFTGVILGVEPDGRLLLRDEAGETRRFRFKEVGYIL